MRHIAEPQLSLFNYLPAIGVDAPEFVTLPSEDNTPEALQALLDANARLRKQPWPQPFDTT